MASIPEQLIAQVYADADLLALATGGLAVGRRETGVHAGPMRVVAIPAGAPQIDAPDRHGDGASNPWDINGPRYTDKGRILLLRRFRIEWECHGAPMAELDHTDFGDAEELYVVTLRAIRGLFHNAVRFENEEWVDQQKDADGYERFGTLITFTSVIDIPVYEPRSVSRLAPVTSIQSTVKLPPTNGETVIINE